MYSLLVRCESGDFERDLWLLGLWLLARGPDLSPETPPSRSCCEEEGPGRPDLTALTLPLAPLGLTGRLPGLAAAPGDSPERTLPDALACPDTLPREPRGEALPAWDETSRCAAAPSPVPRRPPAPAAVALGPGRTMALAAGAEASLALASSEPLAPAGGALGPGRTMALPAGATAPLTPSSSFLSPCLGPRGILGSTAGPLPAECTSCSGSGGGRCGSPGGLRTYSTTVW